jgi:hypothetical protein
MIRHGPRKMSSDTTDDEQLIDGYKLYNARRPKLSHMRLCFLTSGREMPVRAKRRACRRVAFRLRAGRPF